MDPESRLLLYAVVFGAGVGLFSILRRGALSALRFHAGVLAALVTASLAALLAPSLAGVVALPVLVAFCALAVGPSLLIVAGRRLARGRRFGVARALFGAGTLLLGLPVPLRREAQLYGALAASEKGDADDAARRLRLLVDAGGIPALHGGRTLVEALPLAGARRWREVLDVIDRRPSAATAVLAMEARAAAETGDLERAVRACTLLEGRKEAEAARVAARRAVLAAAGRVETIRAAARGRWPVLRGPRGVRELALARAHEARGEIEEAHRLYAVAARRSHGSLRRDAEEGRSRVESEGARLAPAADDALEGVLRLEEACRREAAARAAVPVVRPWATWIASAVTAAVSITVMLRADVDGFSLLTAGALSAPLVADEGQWWRLFTAMLLHGGWWHLILNLGCIVPVGVLVERRIGVARTLLVYLGSGLIGSLASVYLSGTDIGVGASGAAMGLIGALLVLLLRRPRLFVEAERRRWLSLLWLGVAATAVIGLLEHRYIDNAAHGAGLVGGMLLALPLLPTARESRLRRAGAVLGAALLSALLLAAAVEARAEATRWTTPQLARARGAVVELPGWLTLRPLADGSVVAARRPAEIALQIGSLSSATPRPLVLVPDDGPLRDVLAGSDAPATLPQGGFVVPVTEQDLAGGLGEEWAAGVRFETHRSGPAFVLVRIPDDPAADEAYAPLLQRIAATLRSIPAQDLDAVPSSE